MLVLSPRTQGCVRKVCLLGSAVGCQGQARDAGRLDLSPPSPLLPSAYHGHLSSLIDISPYKFRDLDGQKEWVHVVRTAQGGDRSVPEPNPADTALSLPTGTSPRHLPGPLPGGPSQSS